MAKVTSEEMKDFATKYNKSDWLTLCADPEFNRLFTDDLRKARLRANKILKKPVATGS